MTTARAQRAERVAPHHTSSGAAAPSVPAGYKMTEVGMIPEDWDVDNVISYADVITGAKNTQDHIEDGAYPFFVRSQNIERINSYSYDGEAVLTAGDGVGTGKVFHYINGKFDYHQRVYCICNFSDALDGYYFHLYFSTHFYDRIMSMTAKSSVDSVRREMIADMKIPVPSLQEQKAIATALSDVDALLDGLDRLIAKKRGIKQAAMQQLLTGKQRLPGFSGEWIKSTLGDVLEKIVGGGTPNRSNQNFWNGKIPWVTVKDFATFDPLHTQEYITQEGLKCSATHLIPKGTLIISTRMAIGQVVLYELDVSINQDLKALFPSRGISSMYLYFWFAYRRDDIKKLGSGSTVMGISLPDLKNLIFLYPQFEEQTAITTILSDMDTEITTLEAQRDKTAALKQGMMQELLTGRIRLI